MAAIWECPHGPASRDFAGDSRRSPRPYVESLIAWTPLVWNVLTRGKRADLPANSSFHLGVHASDRAGALMMVAPNKFVPRPASRSHSTLRAGAPIGRRALSASLKLQ